MQILRSIVAVYGTSIGGYLAGAIVTIILGRTLLRDEMGQYILIRYTIDILSCLPLLGKDSVFLKFFSHQDIRNYPWKKETVNILKIAAFLIFLSSLLFYFISRLAYWLVIGIAISSFCSSIFVMRSIIERSQERYTKAALISAAGIFIYLISVIIIVIAMRLQELSIILASLFMSYFIAMLLSLSGIRTMFEGEEPLPINIGSHAIVFFILSVIVMSVERAGAFILPRILSYTDLAIYGVIFGLASPFALARTSLIQVLVPHMARSEIFNLPKYIIFVCVCSATLYSAFILFGPSIINILFSGKYDDGINLIPVFGIAGSLQVLTALPGALIGGRISEKALRPYVIGVGIFGMISVLLIAPLGMKWGLKGVVISRIIGLGGEVIVGYIIVMLIKDRSEYA